MVKRVEEFAANLETSPFNDGELANQRQIHRLHAWSIKSVAASVAESVGRRRRSAARFSDLRCCRAEWRSCSAQEHERTNTRRTLLRPRTSSRRRILREQYGQMKYANRRRALQQPKSALALTGRLAQDLGIRRRSLGPMHCVRILELHRDRPISIC
jgi:hypothetical protein